MAGAKEIRTQIGSVKNTQKVTKALEMVSASKIRKSQDRMAASRPYALKIRSVIEMTLVGTKAVTSPACVSMIGSAVSEPVLPLTSPLVNFSTYSGFTRAARSSRRECR